MSFREEKPDAGFTLMELVVVITLLGVLAVTAVVKWPSAMPKRAAVLEFIEAIHYAQHMALTREWSSASSAWGIQVASNKYYVGRADASCTTSCTNAQCGDDLHCNRALLGDTANTVAPTSGSGAIFFNGLGEPISSTGTLLGNTTYLIAGGISLTVCAQTGYVMEGGSCP